MSLAKDILRLVNERDHARAGEERAEREVKDIRKILNDLFEYVEKHHDPEIRQNFRNWADAKIIKQKTWDFGRLLRSKAEKDLEEVCAVGPMMRTLGMTPRKPGVETEGEGE